MTRFGLAADFTDPQIQANLRPYLAAIAHVEEYPHPGSLQVTAQLLNPRHWSAVGSLGAAHFVSDQNQPFVSYYATALVYYINHDGALFKEDYTIASLIGAPIISGLITFFGLSPHKLHQHNNQEQTGGHSAETFTALYPHVNRSVNRNL